MVLVIVQRYWEKLYLGGGLGDNEELDNDRNY